MVIIYTERLVLREFNEVGWRAVHRYASDPEVVRYVDWGPNTEEETRAFVNRALAHLKEKPRTKYTLAIALKEEPGLIGSCDLDVANLENKEGWIGYCLNRQFWGKGFATETAEALLEFGFQRLGLHRIFATVDPDNILSIHVLEKIGMQREGHLREHKWVKAKWRDSLLYAILESEWNKSITRS